MLKLTNITKSFDGKTILDNLNLEVKDNSILSIVGPSGAGKTTLLRCIAGLERVDSGTFSLNNQPFDPYDESVKERVIGVVFQDFNLFPHLSVMENISLAPKLVLKQDQTTVQNNVNNLLEQLGLTSLKNQYPFELSGGQKQRVAIARALAMQPQILCYDEPTSALDPSLRDTVAQVILDLKKTGITQIVITHDPDFAKKIADQLLEVKPLND
ncbi:amino acid ABC transporter ATP-binding protein [Companilactobacillus alimentarius]|uniref:Polar amino acid ABC transporter ATP-binding protein n=1 Tax=Companilactobacillus alimentarius DSM 20249 TaxID=1423720 RepID=A0A2K9HNM9_9LACO|nr:ATP-binding cassette domain-containing protein [Companilactobacillus alimentarius]AUI71843.1 polar amino acid ABC transporter ATP-binding protein [Companilactobacillus alimentarius DSM 20249]KRK76892.1 ABC-type polar amino acid transport system, ATPase component [Companilactobacillus alimentarius DSM 20249]MDT6952369.1 ATP-binding cassette domain-containing protein [Companilactobacillus alimentarius]GEO45162.1 polar amino acid ABC transporter ATP-binding protein [Companilactobacillus aliment